MPLRVTIWNEFVHERQNEDVAAVYPDGIHNVVASALRSQLGDRVDVRTATFEEPEHGLSTDVLDNTDVLFWWGHVAHDQVEDSIVDRVQERVLRGMGLVVLHSAHASKIFRRLMGTGCMLRWRDVGERERLWVVSPSHPIAAGLEEQSFELAKSEMYGEFFDIPQPDELIFVSWFQGGEVFRSGCTFRRGAGKIFYFSPGHETFPIYYDSKIQMILGNAARWAAPTQNAYRYEALEVNPSMEPLD